MKLCSSTCRARSTRPSQTARGKGRSSTTIKNRAQPFCGSGVKLNLTPEAQAPSASCLIPTPLAVRLEVLLAGDEPAGALLREGHGVVRFAGQIPGAAAPVVGVVVGDAGLGPGGVQLDGDVVE